MHLEHLKSKQARVARPIRYRRFNHVYRTYLVERLFSQARLVTTPRHMEMVLFYSYYKHLWNKVTGEEALQR